MEIKDRIIFDQLTKTATIMRDGIYQYLACEVGATNLPANTVVKVYRDKKEVEKAERRFRELQRLPLTINHPLRFLDLKDENSYSKGVSTDPFLGIKDSFTTLGCKISMNDEATELYNNGIKQLSCGWDGCFVKVENEDYDYVQEFLDFNHIAILPDGRGGSLCSIIDNNFNNLKLLELMTKEKLSEEATLELKKTVKDALAEHSQEVNDKKAKDEDWEDEEDMGDKKKAKDKKSKDKKAKDSDSADEEDKDDKKDKKENKDAATATLISDARTALINDYSSIFESIEKGIVSVLDCKGKAPEEIKQIVVEKLLKKKIDVKDHVILDAHYSVALENYSHPAWAGSKPVKDGSISDAAAEIDNINFFESK